MSSLKPNETDKPETNSSFAEEASQTSRRKEWVHFCCLFVCCLLLQRFFLCLTLTCTQTGRWFSDTSTQDGSQLTTDHPLKQQYLLRHRKSESPTVFVDFIQPTHFFSGQILNYANKIFKRYSLEGASSNVFIPLSPIKSSFHASNHSKGNLMHANLGGFNLSQL